MNLSGLDPNGNLLLFAGPAKLTATKAELCESSKYGRLTRRHPAPAVRIGTDKSACVNRSQKLLDNGPYGTDKKTSGLIVPP